MPVDAVRSTEHWFVGHGLPYFVPAERKAVRDALQPRRTLPLLALTALTGVLLAGTLAWVSDDLSFAPATLTLIGVVAGLAYAVTALRARPILGWAVTRTLGGLRQLVPMMTRALPLLLLFVTFLFINGEAWQVAASLDGGVLWLTVLLFSAMGTGFFLVRVPEEIDRADDLLDERRIVEVTAGTPLEDDARRLADTHGSSLVEETQVTGYERANLTLALLITHTAQVLLLALSMLLFFLVFGSIAMDESVVESWIGGSTQHLPGLPNASVELLQVSVFLAAFSGLYFTVYAVTDQTYRDQFFTGVIKELERAIALRAVYTVHRSEPPARPAENTDRALPAPVEDPSPTVPFPRVSSR